MRKQRILVVEDDPQTSAYLKSYFEEHNFDVLTVSQGSEALELCRLSLPNVIILDVHLPDMNGYELCRALRQNIRTGYAPIMFLSPHNKRDDILRAFQVGADDYVLKPFDIEELYLRVKGAIRHSRLGSLFHPVTNLPGGELIVDQLRTIKDSPDPWILLYFHLENFGVFRAVSEASVAASVLVEMADILQDTVERYGAPTDFVGHASDDGFVVITIPETAGVIYDTVRTRFRPEDLTVGQATGLLKLTINAVSSFRGPFTDIREIGQALAASPAHDKFESFEEWSGSKPQIGDLDYYRQLNIQVALWQASPEMAQALKETDQFVTAWHPELVRISDLLDRCDDTILPPDTISILLSRWQEIRWVEENLAELSPKIRRYQKFDPAPVLATLEQVVRSWSISPVTIDSTVAAHPDLAAALPALKLQQVIYNLGQWARQVTAGEKLVISLNLTGDSVELCVTAPDAPKKIMSSRWDWAALVDALVAEQAGAVYAYLARKIVARYGGEVSVRDDCLILTLPTDSHPVKMLKPEVLWKKIRQLRNYLAEQQSSRASTRSFSQAARLVDLLADDLLSAIESMHTFLVQSPAIDLQTYPWNALQQQLRYSRLLALELRQNRPLIPAPVNLKSLLESIEPLVLHRMLDHKIVIESETPRPVINSDQTRLAQIFVSLTLNALESMPAEGTLKFTIKKAAGDSGVSLSDKAGRFTAEDVYIVEISDTGHGIPPEHIPHLFDPHFTTKGEGRGTGLYHVKTYLDQLKGQIEIVSRVGKGTTVRVKLPPAWESGYF